MVKLGKISTAKEKGTHCPICDELVPIITLQEDMCRECFKVKRRMMSYNKPKGTLKLLK